MEVKKTTKRGRDGYSDKEPSPQYVSEPSYTYATHPYTGVDETLGFIGLTSSREDTLAGEEQIITLIRKGIPKKALDTLLSKTELTIAEIAIIIRTSDRTLRRYTSDTILNPEQTERIIELAKLYLRGAEVFGSISEFNLWMKMNNSSLGNKKPKEYIDTSIGIRMLTNELGRIEHGVFA